MEYYVGMDLHSNNTVIVIIDENQQIIFKKRVANDKSDIIELLSPYSSQISAIVVESTYNWYWLVDALKEKGYSVKLANPSQMKQYTGCKRQGDFEDAFLLAKLYRLGVLPTGYIYPKETRGVRDLLRVRSSLVRKQTSLILTIQSSFARCCNYKINAVGVKKLEDDLIEKQFIDTLYQKGIKAQRDLLLSVIEQKDNIEKIVWKEANKNTLFKKLKTVPGIGDILGMSIMLETGYINRFPSAGHYASYCRCVESKFESNGKQKSGNNRKNGNAYLGWSYMEAANLAIINYDYIKRYYQRKASKKHRIIALKTVAAKLARATFYVMRDQVDYDAKKCFGVQS